MNGERLIYLKRTTGSIKFLKQGINFKDMMHRLIISFLSVIVVLNSFCQPYEEKDFTRYTKLDGLSHNSVTGILQDSSGYIWISTKKGLNRFDGRSFSNFFKRSENLPLPENDILL